MIRKSDMPYVAEAGGRWPRRWLCAIRGHVWHEISVVIRARRTPKGSTAWGYEACTRCDAKRFVP